MSDAEARLRAALRRLPEPDGATTERARRAALAAIPSRDGTRRRFMAGALATVAAAALVAGVALGATGRLDVRIGPPPGPVTERPAPARLGELTLPAGVRGMAVVSSGRLWLATRGGLRASGLAVSAAELSPNARYAVVGIGDALVALAPDAVAGRTAWSQPVGGRVVAASWAPNPILIAYIVRVGDRHELRVIEGDGDDDRLVDPDVAPVRPSWRADTGALAYAGAGGALRILDRASGRIQAGPPGTAAVRAVQYSPGGATLALITGHRAQTLVVLSPAPRLALPLPANAEASGLTWRSGELLVALNGWASGAPAQLWTLRPDAGAGGLKALPSGPLPPIAALSASPSGLSSVVRRADATEVWWLTGSLATGPGERARPTHIALRLAGDALAGPVTVSLR